MNYPRRTMKTSLRITKTSRTTSKRMIMKVEIQVWEKRMPMLRNTHYDPQRNQRILSRGRRKKTERYRPKMHKRTILSWARIQRACSPKTWKARQGISLRAAWKSWICSSHSCALCSWDQSLSALFYSTQTSYRTRLLLEIRTQTRTNSKAKTKAKTITKIKT